MVKKINNTEIIIKLVNAIQLLTELQSKIGNTEFDYYNYVVDGEMYFANCETHDMKLTLYHQVKSNYMAEILKKNLTNAIDNYVNEINSKIKLFNSYLEDGKIYRLPNDQLKELNNLLDEILKESPSN